VDPPTPSATRTLAVRIIQSARGEEGDEGTDRWLLGARVWRCSQVRSSCPLLARLGIPDTPPSPVNPLRTSSISTYYDDTREVLTESTDTPSLVCDTDNVLRSSHHVLRYDIVVLVVDLRIEERVVPQVDPDCPSCVSLGSREERWDEPS
jgi:hypothetical protein